MIIPEGQIPKFRPKLPQICVIIQITSQFEPFDNVNATTKYTFGTKYMLLSLQNNCKTVG